MKSEENLEPGLQHEWGKALRSLEYRLVLILPPQYGRDMKVAVSVFLLLSPYSVCIRKVEPLRIK